MDPVSLICTSCGALPGKAARLEEGNQEAHMAHGRKISGPALKAPADTQGLLEAHPPRRVDLPVSQFPGPDRVPYISPVTVDLHLRRQLIVGFRCYV